MTKDSSTECWNQVEIGDWVSTSQTNDFRMYYIMPFTLEKLGNVAGRSILDLGCGEGGYSRALAHRGAAVTAVDCSEALIGYAREKAAEEGLTVDCRVANANALEGIGDGRFDLVLCSMMLMDVEDLDGTLREIRRVLRPGGGVFLSILHPCFKGKETKWRVNESGQIEVLVSDYHHPSEWVGEIKGIDAPIVYRHRTLSDYVTAFVKTGFRIVGMDEPIPTREQSQMSPRVKWLEKIPMYLFMELRRV